MKFNEKYDVFWLIGGGIGNIIESLYSIEYCLMQNLKVGILIESCPESFYKYIKLCYGHIIINLEDLKISLILYSSFIPKLTSDFITNNFFISSSSFS